MDSEIKYFFENNIPASCSIELTNNCNVDCIMCYQHKNTPNELTVAEIKQVITDLADMGCLYLDLTGGEALLKKGAWEIVEHAHNLNFSMQLLSNATTLTPEICEKIARYNIMTVETSLLGATAETHDAIMKSPGAFDKQIAAFDRLYDLGVQVIAKTTVMKQNWREVPDILKLCWAHKTRAIWSVQLTETSAGETAPCDHAMSEEELIAFRKSMYGVENMTALKDKDAIICGAGRTGMDINASGYVYACIKMPKPIGHVRRQSIKDIWNGSGFIEEIRALNEKSFSTCFNCNVQSHCSHCMAETMRNTGSLTGCDPDSKKLADFWAKPMHKLEEEVVK